MRFLACLILTIIIFAFFIVLNWITGLLPIWLGVIVYILGVAFGIYLLTKDYRK